MPLHTKTAKLVDMRKDLFSCVCERINERRWTREKRKEYAKYVSTDIFNLISEL